MYDLNRTFKNYFSQYIAGVHLNEGEIRHARGINDLLIDAKLQNWQPKEFVARLLSQCCVRDRGDADKVLCIVAVEILRDVLNVPPPTDDSQRQQQVRDCFDTVTDAGTYEQILRWAESWF
jgi:hypothetical protein